MWIIWVNVSSLVCKFVAEKIDRAETWPTIIFKSVGTDAPNTHYLPKRDSPSSPIQCWIVLSIFF